MNEYVIQDNIDIPVEVNVSNIRENVYEIDKFSYVITHMNSSDYRHRNIQKVVDHVRMCFSENVEIIIIEQNFRKTNINNVDKHILLQEVGEFKRSKTMNLGALSASYDSVIFADNDIILTKQSIVESIYNLSKYDGVKPYGRMLDLTEAQTNAFFTNSIYPNVNECESRIGVLFAGGAFAIRKRSFCKIGGFDESFIGWGGEDDAFTVKMDKLCRYLTLKDNVSYHLYHDRLFTGTANHIHYGNNVNLVAKIKDMGYDELVSYCVSIRGKFNEMYGGSL